MRKLSCAAGLIVGGTATIVAVIAVPGLASNDGRAGPQRTPRVICEVVEGAPAPLAARARAATPPAEREKQSTTAEELQEEADAVAAVAAGRRSNETAAIATLRNIISAQSQFDITARADDNSNGVGEYGCFGELSGAKGVRGGRVLTPPVLSSDFRSVKDGRVKRMGYYFRIFLARANGEGAHEQPDGGFGSFEVDPDFAETTWCVYAWPVDLGVTGERCFFTNQCGDVLSNNDRRYGGRNEPAAEAAFEKGSRGIIGKIGTEDGANDRGEWVHAG